MDSPPTRRPGNTATAQPVNRDSNALRASILDAALQLGFGYNQKLDNMIFDVVDEEEEETPTSPELTSASTATSDDATLSPFPSLLPIRPLDPNSLALSPHTQFDEKSPFPPSVSPTPSTARQQGSNKLKKPRRDGYESASEAVTKAEEKERKKMEKEEKKRAKKAKKSAGDETEYETDGGYMSEAATSRKKSSKKKSKKAGDGTQAGNGYDTDGGYISSPDRPKPFRSFSGKKSTDAGDISDGGYVSDKKKRSLFRLGSSKGSKKGHTPPEDAPEPPPVPMIPLPIAERFALSLDMIDGSSRSATPLGLTSDSRLGSFDTFMSRDSLDDVSPSPIAAKPQSPMPPVRPETRLPNPWTQDDIAVGTNIPPSPKRTNTNDSAQTTASEPVSTSPTNTPRRRVRWTPSTQSTKKPAIPKISLPLTSMTSAPDSDVSSPEAQNDLYRQLSIATNAANKRVPSPLNLKPRPVPSPVGSDFAVITPGDFIPTPSPSGQQPETRSRSPIGRNPRAHFAGYDLPPPSPPPQGPLPIPPASSDPVSPSRGRQQAPTRPQPPPPPSFPGAGPNGNSIRPPSRAPSPAGSVFSQSIGSIQRGRQSPFPTRPVLPAEESRELVRRTSLQVTPGGIHGRMPQRSASAMSMRQDMAIGERGRDRSREGGRAAPAAWSTRGYSATRKYGSEESALDYDDENIGVALGTPGISVENASEDEDDAEEYDARMRDRIDDEDIRPDVAQFFFSEDGQRNAVPSPQSSPGRSMFVEEFKDDDASVYPRTSVADSNAGYLASPYADDDRTSVWSTGTGGTGFLDEEKSGAVREKFVKRVAQMYGQGGAIPPVPALPRRF